MLKDCIIGGGILWESPFIRKLGNPWARRKLGVQIVYHKEETFRYEPVFSLRIEPGNISFSCTKIKLIFLFYRRG